MCNAKIWAIGNATGVDAKLTNYAYSGDDCAIPNGKVTHTGGSHGDYIAVPDCSADKWFDTHHIKVEAVDGSWAISFWADDGQGCYLTWSSSGAYSPHQQMANSNASESGALMITLFKEQPAVGWAAF
jgi:hypothetical protein